MIVEIKLREVRTARKMTVRELAKRAGVGAATISQIETEAEIPRIDTVAMICTALECNVEDVFVYQKNGKSKARKIQKNTGGLCMKTRICAMVNQIDDAGALMRIFSLCKGFSVAK